jgi:hypothetical protein
MAFTGKWKDPKRLDTIDAYYKFAGGRVDHIGGTMQPEVAVYVSKEVADAKGPTLDYGPAEQMLGISGGVPPFGESIQLDKKKADAEQFYAWVKSKPEVSNKFADVLEAGQAAK